MLFDQQIAVIGGSAGIGFAVADAAADAGAHVVIGSSSQTKLNKALGQFSEKVTGLVVDVTKEESVREFFDKLGEVDHVAITLGRDHPDVATSFNNLAELYRAQGRYQKAEPLYELAELYRAQARYEKAEPLYERALAIFEQALGPNHPELATCLENYAVMLRNVGRPDEAAPLESSARAIRAKAR